MEGASLKCRFIRRLRRASLRSAVFLFGIFRRAHLLMRRFYSAAQKSSPPNDDFFTPIFCFFRRAHLRCAIRRLGRAALRNDIFPLFVFSEGASPDAPFFFPAVRRTALRCAVFFLFGVFQRAHLLMRRFSFRRFRRDALRRSNLIFKMVTLTGAVLRTEHRPYVTRPYQRIELAGKAKR